MTERATTRLQSTNKIMTEISEDEPLKDELIDMATEIQQCNFNVRQFKKTHLAKPIKLNHQNSKDRTVSRLKTQPHTFSNSLYPNKKLDQNLRKSLRLNDTFISPQIPENKSRSKAFFSKSMSGLGQSFTRSRSLKKQQIKNRDINKLQKYEQKWNKEKMSEKCLEAWLNSILIQFCSNEYFDQKIPNCALKKMGIDENSLVAKGLPPGNVNRLYRGLFVFGMGFNELIRQLTGGNMDVCKIIWKIYSIVLEYCSKGGLETVIGEIERDHDMKIIQLTTELQRKQQIIEKNEELNQKKNNQIFKQIKNLRQDNINLNNEKSVLLDEFSSTQQAFSEEIGLRLKFQSKINEIYGLHRELGMKHQRLYHELVQKAQQLKSEAQKYFLVVGRIAQYKENLMNLREQMVVLKQKSQREGEHLKEANKQITSLAGKISNLEYQADYWQTLYKQLKVKEKQWQIERNNMEVIVDMRQKSTKQTYKQYQLTLEENNRLYIMISDQRKSMEQFQKQKRNFNSKIISIVAENSFSKRKLQEMLKKHQQLTLKHNQLFKSAEKMKEQNQVFTKSEEGYKIYFDSVQENIAQMHKMNMTQSEQLLNLKQFYQSANKIITSKNKSIESFTQHQQNLSKSIETMNKENQTLKSQNIILSQKLNLSENLLRIKQTKLQLLRGSYDERQLEVSSTLLKQAEELQTSKNQLQIVLRQYKNEKFERNALNAMYGQTLKIIESKNQEQKNLRVKLSLLEGQVSKQKNNYHILEKNMFKTIEGFSKLQQSLEEVLQKQRSIIYERNQHIHPMYVEQMRTYIYQLSHKNQLNQSALADIKLELMKQKILGKQKVQKISQESRWQVSKIKIENERTIQTLKNELSFSKEQYSKQRTKLDQLQEVAESYRKKIYEKSSSEREQIYKYMIQQKSKQISNMLQQMEILSDALAKAKLQLAQKENSHQAQLSQENQQYKKYLEQSIRKQLSHQYDLKLRQAIRSMKLQYSKKQAQLKEEAQNLIKMMTIQEILKIKNISSEQLLMGSGRQHNGRLTLGPDRQNRWGRDQAQRELSLSRQQVNTRKQMSRLLKNTYKYYEQ